MTESMRPPTRKPWNTRSLAVSGAFFGTIAGTVQVMSEAFRPGFDASEPFHQCFLEIVAGTVAGALLFAAVAWMRNRMVRA